MIDLSQIVSVVEIDRVRLCEARFRSAVQPEKATRSISLNLKRRVEIVNESQGGGSFQVKVGFDLAMHRDDDEKELQAEIRGVFELSYRLPKEAIFSSETLEAFANFNAVFNAWPYWREFVQASLTRMAMPPLTIPVFRVQPHVVVADHEEEDEPHTLTED